MIKEEVNEQSLNEVKDGVLSWLDALKKKGALTNDSAKIRLSDLESEDGCNKVLEKIKGVLGSLSEKEDCKDEMNAGKKLIKKILTLHGHSMKEAVVKKPRIDEANTRTTLLYKNLSGSIWKSTDKFGNSMLLVVDDKNAKVVKKLQSYEYVGKKYGDLVDQYVGKSESMTESLDAVWADYQSIEKFLEENDFTNYELVDYSDYPMQTSKISIAIDGDWKHDHGYFKHLISEWAKQNNRKIFKFDEDDEPSDDDWYRATYHIYIAKDNNSFNTLNSMRGLFAEGKSNKVFLSEREAKFRTDVIDSGYDDSGKPWADVKKELIQQYKKKGYTNVEVQRNRTDTKGLKMYSVYGTKNESLTEGGEKVRHKFSDTAMFIEGAFCDYLERYLGEEYWARFNEDTGLVDIYVDDDLEDTVSLEDAAMSCIKVGSLTLRDENGKKITNRNKLQSYLYGIDNNEFKESLTESRPDGYSVSDLEKAVKSALRRFGFDAEHGYDFDFIPHERGSVPYLEAECADGIDEKDFSLINRIFSRGASHWFDGFDIDVFPGKEHKDGGWLSIIFDPRGMRHYFNTDDDKYDFLSGEYRTESLKESNTSKCISNELKKNESLNESYDSKYRGIINYIKVIMPKDVHWSYDDYRVEGDDFGGGMRFQMEFDSKDESLQQKIINAIENHFYGVRCSAGWGSSWDYYISITVDRKACNESLNEARPLAKSIMKRYNKAYKSFDSKRDWVRGENDRITKKWNEVSNGTPTDDETKDFLLKKEPSFDNYKPNISGSLEQEEYPFYVTVYEETPYYHPEEGGYYVAGREATMSKGFENRAEAIQYAKELADDYDLQRLSDTHYSTNSKYIGDNTHICVETSREYLKFEKGDEMYESLTEDTVKTKDGKWTNKGDEGTHGKFKTKKEADAQRKAMFANGYHESFDGSGKSYCSGKREVIDFLNSVRSLNGIKDRDEALWYVLNNYYIDDSDAKRYVDDWYDSLHGWSINYNESLPGKRLTKKFSSLESAKKFMSGLSKEAEARMDYFDKENEDGSVDEWWEVYYLGTLRESFQMPQRKGQYAYIPWNNERVLVYYSDRVDVRFWDSIIYSLLSDYVEKFGYSIEFFLNNIGFYIFNDSEEDLTVRISFGGYKNFVISDYGTVKITKDNEIVLKDFTTYEELACAVMECFDRFIETGHIQVVQETPEVDAEKVRTLKLMHKVMQGMNNEDAYYSWIVTGVPDGASEDDYESIAEDEDEYSDAVQLFNRLFKRYAKDGLFNPSPEEAQFAKEKCKELGIADIEILGESISRKSKEEPLVYDEEAPERWEGLFDVETPQEMANTTGKPVKAYGKIYTPKNKDELDEQLNESRSHFEANYSLMNYNDFVSEHWDGWTGDGFDDLLKQLGSLARKLHTKAEKLWFAKLYEDLYVEDIKKEELGNECSMCSIGGVDFVYDQLDNALIFKTEEQAEKTMPQLYKYSDSYEYDEEGSSEYESMNQEVVEGYFDAVNNGFFKMADDAR